MQNKKTEIFLFFYSEIFSGLRQIRRIIFLGTVIQNKVSFSLLCISISDTLTEFQTTGFSCRITEKTLFVQMGWFSAFSFLLMACKKC